MKPFVFRLLFLLLFAGAAPFVHADSGAREVKYSDNDIIPIRAKVRFSTLIVLPADEEILDFTTGDKDFWIINVVHNLSYFHPAHPGIRSNQKLVTASGHVYSFLLTEISKEADSDPDLKVCVAPNEEQSNAGHPTTARFARASEVEAYQGQIAELRTELAGQIQQAQEHAASEVSEFKHSYPAKLDFDYMLNKKASRAPFLVSAVYHDEAFTYIKMSAREKPAIYEIKDGKPNLLNFQVENGVYIVPKIMDSGYLIVGKKRVTFTRQSN
jgi:type IV secretory pathway VirB9-like protein